MAILKKIMKLDEFCSEYEIRKESVYTARRRGTIDKSIIFKPANSSQLYVKVHELERRHEFRRKNMMYVHDFFYVFTEHTNITVFSDILWEENPEYEKDSWRVYIDHMFSVDRDNFLNYKMTRREWLIFRSARKFERVMKMKYKNFNMSEILDKRMKQHMIEEKIKNGKNTIIEYDIGDIG